jgi:hypothetical protein
MIREGANLKCGGFRLIARERNSQRERLAVLHSFRIVLILGTGCEHEQAAELGLNRRDRGVRIMERKATAVEFEQVGAQLNHRCVLTRLEGVLFFFY